MEIDSGDYGPTLNKRKAASLVGLEADRKARQELRGTPKPGLESSGSALVRDLILDGDLGREVLRHWLITLDLAAGRGWIKQAAQ